MHPFPPPPHFWDTRAPAFLLYLFLLISVMGITAAVLLMRSKRKAQTHDIGIWIGAGIVMTAVFIGIASRYPPASGFRDGFLLTLWIAVALGCWGSWLRWREQENVNDAAPRTIVILLVGVGLMALIANAMSPQQYERSGRLPPCRNNLHNIGVALHNYHESFDSLPPQSAGEPPVSWRVEILPYLGRDDLHRSFDFFGTWDSPRNLPVARSMVETYTCPSVHASRQDRDGLRFTSYAVAAGEGTLWQGDQPISLNAAKDGTSHTLLVVEACGQQIVWTEPRDMDVASTPRGFNLPGDVEGQSPGLFSSYHTGGAFGLMGDGSVRFLSNDINPEVIDALLTADGGETVGDF